MKYITIDLTMEEAETLKKLLEWNLQDASMMKPENRARAQVLKKLVDLTVK